MCPIGDRLVAVLDVDRLLRSPDIRQFDEPTDKAARTAQDEDHHARTLTIKTREYLTLGLVAVLLRCAGVAVWR